MIACFFVAEDMWPPLLLRIGKLILNNAEWYTTICLSEVSDEIGEKNNGSRVASFYIMRMLSIVMKFEIKFKKKCYMVINLDISCFYSKYLFFLHLFA